MTRSNFIKPLTIFSSLSLVTLFLLYRTGFFVNDPQHIHSSLQTSPNGGTIQTAAADTLKKDSTKKLLFPSSKSMPLPLPSLPTVSDPKYLLIPPKEIQLMTGSKSGAVVYRDTLFKKILDSFIKSQTFKKKP
jgi:hypothetical protein